MSIFNSLSFELAKLKKKLTPNYPYISNRRLLQDMSRRSRVDSTMEFIGGLLFGSEAASCLARRRALGCSAPCGRRSSPLPMTRTASSPWCMRTSAATDRSAVRDEAHAVLGQHLQRRCRGGRHGQGGVPGLRHRRPFRLASPPTVALSCSAAPVALLLLPGRRGGTEVEQDVGAEHGVGRAAPRCACRGGSSRGMGGDARRSTRV